METGFELPSFRGHGRHQYCRDITLGKYTHIWISAEAVLGDLVEKKSQEYKPNKSRKVTRWSGCEYEDRGTFTSVIQYPVPSTPMSCRH